MDDVNGFKENRGLEVCVTAEGDAHGAEVDGISSLAKSAGRKLQKRAFLSGEENSSQTVAC